MNAPGYGVLDREQSLLDDTLLERIAHRAERVAVDGL
jgi:hypothetical protein